MKLVTAVALFTGSHDMEALLCHRLYVTLWTVLFIFCFPVIHWDLFLLLFSWQSTLMYLQNVLDKPSPPHLFFPLPQVWVIRTPPAQPCPRKAKRAPRRPTTLNWEVTSTGRCWCLEGSGCTPTSRSRCSWGRTPTSRTDTEPTCPPGSASRGERHQEMEYFFFFYK